MKCEIKRPTFSNINVSLDEKLQMFNFYHFYLLLFKQSVKYIIYLILKKLNHIKPNYIFLALFFFHSEIFYALIRI